MSSNIIHSNVHYARDIGFDYGHADSKVQADLFNGLAQGFKTFTGGRGVAHDMQMSYMADGLTDTAKKFITDLAENVEAANE
ncbi:MAG: hypothetical protein L0L76_10435 [Yaniella sp.]|uniref:hypothetical protein n=1 Tax=Yaniella sp. TaxID=2773929 RepID=UPI00264A04ED|nr:hypothetical protein [Yaniella sp.]MDN6759006.1 hypothetical protein [Yaniella sp.]